MRGRPAARRRSCHSCSSPQSSRRSSNGPTRVERGAADRHVRAPRVRRRRGRRAQVERGDRRPLAPAHAEARVLEPRADRAGEARRRRARRRRAATQRASQPRAHLDVVVDERDQLAAGRRDAGVAGGVQAARPVVRDERAPWRSASDRARSPGPARRRRRAPRRPPRAPAGAIEASATVEVVAALARRDDDRDGGPRARATGLLHSVRAA